MTHHTILISVPSLKKDPGGVSNYYNAILPHLSKRPGIRVATFETGSTHGRNWPFHKLTDQIRFIKTLLTIMPDLVHVNPSLNLKSFIRDGLYILWARLLGIKVLVFFRGWEASFEKKVSRIFWPFFSLTYRKADAYIVLGNSFKEKLISWVGNKPVYLFTTTVDQASLNTFSMSRKTEWLRSEIPIRILFLSRLEPQKGAEVTLEAVYLLLKKRYDVMLTLAGEGSLTPLLKNRIKTLGLSQRVAMPGYLRGEKKARLMSGHHIYCFPTNYDEGMPNSLLEAMAFGMAVITTPKGGIKDFFESGVMGFFCSPPTPGHLKETLEKLIATPDRIAQMAAYNHQYARTHFLATKGADKLLRVYTTILK